MDGCGKKMFLIIKAHTQVFSNIRKLDGGSASGNKYITYINTGHNN